MDLLLKRIYKGPKYTIGHLYINGQYFCDTLEDVDRGLHSDMPLSEINRIKVAGRTAIPTGTYFITLGIQSPKFSDKKYEKQYGFCKGYLPRLLNVRGFEGILIHIGNTDTDTYGCILVGYNTVKGKVTNSTATFHKLYEILQTTLDVDDGEDQETIKITIE